MAAYKRSRQREEIRDNLRGRYDHPTAERIYTDLRSLDPKLSLGTVYRNLSVLSELGEIRRIAVPDGPDHYDGDISAHQHFYCRKCGRISDVRGCSGEQWIAEASKGCGGEIESLAVMFFGVCKECLG
jgi:Fur family peroxide stress response transcriptional regulator